MIKAHQYRKYDQSYYEEIVIDYALEGRITLNFRDRFLVTKAEQMIVMEMYSKNDYVSHFIKILDATMITHEQFVELFCISLKNDAFKVAMQIYLRFLTAQDINEKIIDILVQSVHDSRKFHEIKLFFLLEHFDSMSII